MQRILLEGFVYVNIFVFRHFGRYYRESGDLGYFCIANLFGLMHSFASIVVCINRYNMSF
jgi:hypothetical protein